MGIQKKYDITIYGATGFTGVQAAHSLYAQCQKYGLTFAISGRNREKLEDVAQELRGKLKVGILVAESSDRKALDALTEQTKVVVNLAGPFAKYAPHLIASCVENHCDYVDITGEAPFIAEMIQKHHKTAQKNGVRIVPFCGFDSVPSDLGWYFMLREWRKKFKASGEACKAITSYFQMKGGFNGGTALSAVQMAKEGKMDVLAQNLTLLCDAQAPQPPVKPDWKLPRKVKELSAYAAPFFMAPINTRVVRRSQTLFALEENKNFSPTIDFSYEEAVMFQEPFPIISALVSGVMFGLDVFSHSPAMLSLGEKIIPAPGTGPSQKAMDSGFTKVNYVAIGEKGSVLKAKLFSKGDPGNRTTIKILAQTALCLAVESERKKLPDVSGVLTPAYAFRDVLIQRLIDNDVSLEIIP